MPFPVAPVPAAHPSLSVPGISPHPHSHPNLKRSVWSLHIFLQMEKAFFSLFFESFPLSPCPASMSPGSLKLSFFPFFPSSGKIHRKTPEASGKTSRKLPGTKTIWESSAGAECQPGMRERECFSKEKLPLGNYRWSEVDPEGAFSRLPGNQAWKKKWDRAFAALLDHPGAQTAGKVWR